MTIIGKILRGASDVGLAAIDVLTFNTKGAKGHVDDFNNLSGYTATQAKMKAQIDEANAMAKAQQDEDNGITNNSTPWYEKLPNWAYFLGFLVIIYLVFSNNKNKR